MKHFIATSLKKWFNSEFGRLVWYDYILTLPYLHSHQNFLSLYILKSLMGPKVRFSFSGSSSSFLQDPRFQNRSTCGWKKDWPECPQTCHKPGLALHLLSERLVIEWFFTEAVHALGPTAYFSFKFWWKPCILQGHVDVSLLNSDEDPAYFRANCIFLF